MKLQIPLSKVLLRNTAQKCNLCIVTLFIIGLNTTKNSVDHQVFQFLNFLTHTFVIDRTLNQMHSGRKQTFPFLILKYII